uniref:Ig-like domain-containing protein n=1 Tax=Xenopus tropicalis TaxID=8364 RepID=A0A6I8SMK3_XENTR
MSAMAEGDPSEEQYGSYELITDYPVVYEYTEHFPNPELRVSPDLITEGSHISLPCHSHSLPKDTLEFALYRDGFILHPFAKDNTWHIYSFEKEHSGNYTCVVISSPSPKDIKLSNTVNIHIKGKYPQVQNTVRLTASAFIFLLASCLLFHHLKSPQQVEPNC